MSESPSTPKGRVSGKIVAVGVVIGLMIGVGSAVTLWFRGRVPSGPIAAIEAIDEGRAMLLRQGFEERGYTHLVVWHADGGQRWSEALFGVQDPPAMARLGDLGLIRVTEARGNPSLHAFNLDTGEFMWRGPYPDPERVNEREPFEGDALHTIGDVAFEIIASNPIEILVVDSSGELVGHVTLPEESGEQHAFVSGEVLLVQTGETWHEVSVAGELATATPQAPPEPLQMASGETCAPSGVDSVIWACANDEVIRR